MYCHEKRARRRGRGRGDLRRASQFRYGLLVSAWPYPINDRWADGFPGGLPSHGQAAQDATERGNLTVEPPATGFAARSRRCPWRTVPVPRATRIPWDYYPGSDRASTCVGSLQRWQKARSNTAPIRHSCASTLHSAQPYRATSSEAHAAQTIFSFGRFPVPTMASTLAMHNARRKIAGAQIGPIWMRLPRVPARSNSCRNRRR